MKLLDQIWPLYERAFPAHERRQRLEQEALSKNENYHIMPCFQASQVIGFCCYWHVYDFLFAEHLAVAEDWRGKGYGKKLVQKLLAKGLPVILEVEPPENKIAKKRVQFYEQMGFYLNGFEYWQPAYSPEKKPVSLLLMSYPNKILAEESTSLVKQIHEVVYGKSN